MRWNCEQKGCFNVKKRPKIELLNDALPGKIMFGDVDGIVEISGRTLMLEFKGEMMPLSTGQRLMYERITVDGKATVMIVVGDAETMHLTHYALYWRGRRSPAGSWTPANIDDVKQRIRKWATFAQSNPLWPPLRLAGAIA